MNSIMRVLYYILKNVNGELKYISGLGAVFGLWLKSELSLPYSCLILDLSLT